jgi:hypothetical protein
MWAPRQQESAMPSTSRTTAVQAAGSTQDESTIPASGSPSSQEVHERERWIDAENEQSFPASDPTSWTFGSDREAP